MSNSKKILITSETSEIFIVRTNDNTAIPGYCEACRKEVEMLSLDDAVSLSRHNTRELIRRVDSGLVHSYDTASGHLLVCSNSLKAFMRGVPNEKEF